MFNSKTPEQKLLNKLANIARKEQESLRKTPRTESPRPPDPEEKMTFSNIVARLRLCHANGLRLANGEKLPEEAVLQSDMSRIQTDLHALLKLGKRQKVTIRSTGTTSPVFFITIDTSTIVFKENYLSANNIASYQACKGFDPLSITIPQQGQDDLTLDIAQFVTDCEFVMLADELQLIPAPHEAMPTYVFSQCVSGCDLTEFFTNPRYLSDEALIPKAIDIILQVAARYYAMWHEVKMKSSSEKGSRKPSAAQIVMQDGKPNNIVIDLQTMKVVFTDLKSWQAGVLCHQLITFDEATQRWTINTGSPIWGGAITTTAYNLNPDLVGEEFELNSKNPAWDPEVLLCHHLACTLYEMVTRRFLCREFDAEFNDPQASLKRNEYLEFNFSGEVFNSEAGKQIKTLILRLSIAARTQSIVPIEAITHLREAVITIHRLQHELENAPQEEALNIPDTLPSEAHKPGSVEDMLRALGGGTPLAQADRVALLGRRANSAGSLERNEPAPSTPRHYFRDNPTAPQTATGTDTGPSTTDAARTMRKN